MSDDIIHKLRIMPHFTVERLAHLCSVWSTDDTEVYVRIESINGRPVAYFVRAPRAEFVPHYIRRQAE